MKKRSELWLALFVGVVYVMGALYVSFFDAGQFSQHGYPIHDGGDSYEYALLAQNLATYGEYTLSDTFVPEMFRSPGYSAFLATTYYVDTSFIFAILIQVLLVVCTAVLIFRISKRVLPDQWAFAPALVYVLDPTTLFYSVSIFSDALFVFLLVLAVYLLFVVPRTYHTVFFSGLVLGAAALVRPLGEHLAILVACSVLVREYSSGMKIAFQRTVVLVLGVVLILTPWYVRNFEYSGAVGLSSTGAYTVLFFDVREFLINQGMTATDADKKINAVLGDVPDTKNIAYSGQLSQAAKTIIGQNLFAYSMYHIVGSTNLYIASSIRDTALNLPRAQHWLIRHNLMGDTTVNLKEMLVRNPLQALTSVWHDLPATAERAVRVLIGLLALGSLWVAYKRPEHRMFILTSFVLVGYIALATGPVSYPRYRMPAEPFLCILALITIRYTLRWYEKKQ